MKPSDLMALRDTSQRSTGAAWVRPSVDSTKSQRAQLHDVAKEFEAVFLNEFLNQARSGELAEGLLTSEAGKTFQGMLDTEVSRSATRGVNLGIADAMVRQLGRALPGEDG
jgi:flagellar protein FlgJ